MRGRVQPMPYVPKIGEKFPLLSKKEKAKRLSLKYKAKNRYKSVLGVPLPIRKHPSELK